MQPTIYVALGAISAAFITGIFAFFALIITKEQKTSEFRQQWIDALRDEISEFIGACGHTVSLWAYITETAKNSEEYREMERELIEKNRSELIKIVSMRSKILLRINPKEHKDLIEKIEAVFNSIKDKRKIKITEARPLLDNLIAETQKVLKAEWTRVKKGEIFYRVSRACVVIALIGAVATAAKIYPKEDYSTKKLNDSKVTGYSLPSHTPEAEKIKLPEEQPITPTASSTK